MFHIFNVTHNLDVTYDIFQKHRRYINNVKGGMYLMFKIISFI